jgi:membrane-bound ClpP family serine protease
MEERIIFCEVDEEIYRAVAKYLNRDLEEAIDMELQIWNIISMPTPPPRA